MKVYPRRKKIIDKAAQIKCAALVVGYLIGYLVLLNLIIYVPIIATIDSNEAALADQALAAQQFFFLEQKYLPALFFITLIFGVHSIFVTHKVFGPLYRLKSLLGQIAEGDYSVSCHLRGNDYLKDVAEAFNKMIGALNSRLKELLRANEKNSMALSELASDLNKGDTAKEEIAKRIQEISENMKRTGCVF